MKKIISLFIPKLFKTKPKTKTTFEKLTDLIELNKKTQSIIKEQQKILAEEKLVFEEKRRIRTTSLLNSVFTC